MKKAIGYTFLSILTIFNLHGAVVSGGGIKPSVKTTTVPQVAFQPAPINYSGSIPASQLISPQQAAQIRQAATTALGSPESKAIWSAVPVNLGFGTGSGGLSQWWGYLLLPIAPGVTY